MKNIWLIRGIIITVIAVSNLALAGNLKVYYTRLNYEDKISGKYADIVIEVGTSGKLVFSRESSYLPYWETAEKKHFLKEVVKRNGDGSKNQPDKFNRYSYVRIIEKGPERVVVHWRYFPDFLNTGMDGAVHEVFTLTGEGNLERVIREATDKIYLWRQSEQSIQLTASGFEEVSFEQKTIAEQDRQTVPASEVRQKINKNPAAQWRFDDGMQGYTEYAREGTSNINCQISGPESYWVKGVSGTALQFDGYTSGVKFPVEYAPKIAVEFTIEAWVALAAHPFGWVPIVQQSQWKNNGYYLGINAYGQVGFHWNNGGEWMSVVTANKVELNQWVHIALTFSEESEKLVVYINGEREADAVIVDNGPPTIIHANAPLTIGLNNYTMLAHPREKFTYGQYPCITGIEGAIDEVAFYHSEFSEAQVKRSCKNFNTSGQAKLNPEFEKRILPGKPGKAKKFSAYYDKLKYHKLWDNLWRTSEWPDIVVKFDELPTSVVFWRGPTYGPGWVTENNLWMVDQSVESGNIVSYGEHMSDKQARYNHVRLIENSPARVVIHWRYSANDVLYSFLKPYGEAGVWVDEYWTIYPDGIGIRKVNKRAIRDGIERESIDWEDRDVQDIAWQDVQFLAQPGMTPDDVMNLEAVHLANLKGETAVMDWSSGVPLKNPLKSANIERINIKSEYKPFLIFQDGTFINPWGKVPDDMYCHFMTWNHWPVAMISSQGKSSLFPDRVTHSALCAADNAVDHGDMALYGFTQDPVENLVPLARSWCNPPELTNLQGAKGGGYLKEERAYLMQANSDVVAFELDASESSPVVNPCFVIHNYLNGAEAQIFVNGVPFGTREGARQGNTISAAGNETFIIWLKLETDSPIQIELR